MAGHSSMLPLGQRVRLKVIGIIREEMDRIGAQEFLMPVMHPAELWVKSGRWELMGDELFRLKDRKGADFVLGMTHEEIISTLATEMESYRELPQMWYQFQTKMRDEPRPKAGLMRTREFTMKDSYSFDLDAAGLDQSFIKHRDAYVRIFERLSVPAIPVAASSGAMGGSDSTEFVCPSPSGEDLIVLCPECGYAANIEKAASRLAAVDDSERAGLLAAPEPFATPGVRTIEDLAVQYQAPADRREVAAGDECVNCGHGLEVERGIEVGHIFKLGYKYSDAMEIRVSGPDGKPVKPIMGCYGIGVERAMATIVEVHHDDKGIIWPAAVAPFEVVVVIAQQEDATVAEAGERVYQALLEAGVEVIVDDRHVRAGVKFSAAELVAGPDVPVVH